MQKRAAKSDRHFTRGWRPGAFSNIFGNSIRSTHGASQKSHSPILVSEFDLEEFQTVSRVQYDAAKHLFRIPMLLQPNHRVAFTLTGFRSAAGVPAAPVQLQYQVAGEELAEKQNRRRKMEADAREPELLKVLETMKQKRLQLTSLTERVQNLMLAQKDGVFCELQSQSGIFKWQKSDQFYVDITGPMLSCSDSRMGSDGQQWWRLDKSSDGTNFVVCPVKEIQKLNTAICDPFNLTRMTPAATAARMKLKYDGLFKLGATDYFQMEAWHMSAISKEAPFGSVIQWWIDPQNYRPAQITVFDSHSVLRERFLYDSVNETLPAGDFAVPRLKGLVPVPPEPLDAGYTNRFVKVSDGSDGNMNVAYGEEGPKGTSGSSFIMDGY